MKNILQEVFSKLTTKQTLSAVAENLPAKLVASTVTASFLDVLTIMVVFFGLECLDILTRWIALAREYWVHTYSAEIVKKQGTLWMYLRWIPECHRFRYVDSYTMRNQFCSKFWTYLILICSSLLGDIAMKYVNGISFLMMITVSILSCTEILSILENLDEAGIGVAKEIRNLVQKRKETLK